MAAQDLTSIDHIIDIARGATAPDPVDQEHRQTRRIPYDGTVALVQITPDGGKSIPTVVRCRNVSAGGMCIHSRYMLHIGYEGAILMMRSNGEAVIIGAKIVHCKYIGDMLHESGVEFIPSSVNFMMDDFCDEQGNMPRLEQPRAA
ncbi:MAG: PilZ domain-containing protein [Planctomycetota bacterium]|nr:PilZ domain-containing protein [Planctomycetota bacterium]